MRSTHTLCVGIAVASFSTAASADIFATSVLSYDASTNAVRFTNGYAPQMGAGVEVSYQ